MDEDLMVASSPACAFVTGATGGIGSFLCLRLMEEGSKVVALARAGSDARSIENRDGITVIRRDLLDEAALTEAMRGCDTVFHLAATVHAPAGTPDSEFQRVNVAGTDAVLRAAAAAGASTFVFFSTVAVYPDTEELLDESSPVDPATPYGISKLAAESLVLAKGESMRVTVLRLPVVYGPYDRGNVRRMIAAIAKRRFAIPGSGDNVKTMVGVDTVALAAIHVASDPRAAGRVYLVTDEHPATLLDIVSAIARNLGGERLPPRIPRSVLAAAGKLADFLRRTLGLRLPISDSEVRKLATNTRYNGERIRRELGFRPRSGLEDGLAAAVAGYLAEQRDGGRPPAATDSVILPD